VTAHPTNGKPGRTKLREVTAQAPCPVCGKGHKCARGEDGIILCGREAAEVPGFVRLGPCEKDPQ
jgi:hypothetical protein